MGRDTLSFVKPGAGGPILSVTVESRDLGDEIVVSLSGQQVCRVSTLSLLIRGTSMTLSVTGFLASCMIKSLILQPEWPFGVDALEPASKR